MPWLRVLVRRGSYCRPYVFVDKSIVVVGREETCDVVVDDKAVSSCHALLEHDGKNWLISDRDSYNGTYVGGIALAPRSPRIVPARCWVQIGNTELEVFGARPSPRPHGCSPVRYEVELLELRREEDVPVFLVCVEGGASMTKLTARQRPYRIGRSRLCEIRGDTQLPSEEQAELRVSEERIDVTNICEHGESIGLGRNLISEGMSSIWQPRDMMRVGGMVLAIWDSVQDALDELHASDLAAKTAVPEDPNAAR